MRKLLLAISAVLVSVGTPAQRYTESLNFGWEFSQNNTDGWKQIDVPHDFQIEQPWVAPAPDERPDNSDAAANIRSLCLQVRQYIFCTLNNFIQLTRITLLKITDYCLIDHLFHITFTSV